MPNPSIEEFARLLVQQVRDVAVRGCDFDLGPDGRSVVAQRWRQTAAKHGGNLPAEVLIPDVVDATIAALLGAIDQELLRLLFVDSSGDSVDLVEEGDGELSGWYMGSEGWRRMYSNERFNDDFADLAEWKDDS